MFIVQVYKLTLEDLFNAGVLPNGSPDFFGALK